MASLLSSGSQASDKPLALSVHKGLSCHPAFHTHFCTDRHDWLARFTQVTLIKEDMKIINDLLSALILFGIGYALFALYPFFAKRRHNTNLDLVQAVMYRVNTKNLPFKERLFEKTMNTIKFFGIGLMIISPLPVFHH
jgi:hypothetical protein